MKTLDGLQDVASDGEVKPQANTTEPKLLPSNTQVGERSDEGEG